MQQAHGLMVNYLYKLDDIVANHEALAQRGEVIASPAVKSLSQSERRKPPRRQWPARRSTIRADHEFNAWRRAKVSNYLFDAIQGGRTR